MSESAWIQLPGQRRTEKRSFSVARVLDVWSTHGLEGVRLMPVYDLAVALSVLFSGEFLSFRVWAIFLQVIGDHFPRF